MGTYVVVLVAGVAVDVFYGCLGVNSPALPVVALAGLYGMVIGEQIIPVGKRLLAGHSLLAAWTGTLAGQQVSGMLPGDRGQAVQYPCKASEEQP